MEENNQSKTIENNSDNKLTAFTMINYIISFKQVISLVKPYHALIVEIIDYPGKGHIISGFFSLFLIAKTIVCILITLINLIFDKKNALINLYIQIGVIVLCIIHLIICSMTP